MQLADKTIIITGASSGIGATAAPLFAAEGANLVLGARRKDRLDQLVERIIKSGGKAIAVAGDIREEEHAAALMRHAISEFGGLNAAFNNAGIMGDMVAVPDMAASNWHDVIATNLTSAFYAAKYQIPAIRDCGGGAIVFTSSFVGHTNAGLPGMGAYAASKAALIGLVRSLSSEHGRDHIRVNALLPGGTKTPMGANDPAAQDYVAGLHALKRMASPEEIARAALFLLSDQSTFVTGSAMLADGGISINLT